MIHALDSVSAVRGHGAFAGTVFCIKNKGPISVEPLFLFHVLH